MTRGDHAGLRLARACCNAGFRGRRTAELVVPSVIARRERNVLLNPQNTDFTKTAAGSPEPGVCEVRLPCPSRRSPLGWPRVNRFEAALKARPDEKVMDRPQIQPKVLSGLPTTQPTLTPL
jgi:hypothetical protein